MATAAKSDWGIIAIALLNFLRQCNIQGVPSDNVKIQKLPLQLKDYWPGVYITPAIERITGRGNASDTWVFRMQVTVISASNGVVDDFAQLDAFMFARQKMFEELLPTFQPILNSLGKAFTLDIEPGPVIDPASFDGGYDAQAFIVAVSQAKNRKRPAAT